MATMRALTFDATEGVTFRKDYPVPVRNTGEALIRVIRAGICKTDVEITKGYANFSGVLGHEFLGVVEDVDDGSKVATGQRVTGDINMPCEKCDVCEMGGVAERNHCPNRKVLGILKKDGAFADYITLPVNNLHPIPEHIPDECAVFAEPLGAAFRIVEQDLINDTRRVAVIGDGKLGLLITEVVFAQKPKELVIFGKHQEKMDLLPKEIRSIVLDENTVNAHENKFDVVVEASGNPTGLKMAMSLARPLAVIVLKSTCALGAEFNTFPIVVKELKVIGSRCGNFDMALKALGSKDICPQNMITKIYPFEESVQALAHASERGAMKIQMLFN